MTDQLPTRAEILEELGDVLRRKRRSRDEAAPEHQGKHNQSINRIQAAYDYIMKTWDAKKHGW